MNPIAKRIQEARLKAKMSEKELAKKCGLSASYIIQIESGKKIINDKAAESIMAVFGQKVDSYDAYLDDAAKSMAVEAKPVVKKSAEVKTVSKNDHVVIEPNDQWAGALANIIKAFDIKDMKSGKAVGSRELPVLGKKVDGVPSDRLAFLQVSDDAAKVMRICKDDILWIQICDEVSSNGVYVLEEANKKQICRVEKQYGQLHLSQGNASDKRSVDAKGIKVVGKVVRVEFKL